MKTGIRQTLCMAALVSLFATPLVMRVYAQPAPFVPPAPNPMAGGPIPIKLESAVPLEMPVIKHTLKPQAIKLKGKIQGWAVKIPEEHPIATPAYYNGKLYVGGGYGSHEFYAFDAQSGALAWKYHTDDDGPSAAVVEDNCVAFNTESCTVFVLAADTGKLLWKEWLGDPLMSQPAISKGKLYIAYPSNKGGTSHRLLCANLKTGKHIWDKPISGDVITAPVVQGESIYVACMDGESYCFNSSTGQQLWKRKGSATSAPVVYNGKMIFSERAQVKGETHEALASIETKSGSYASAKRMISFKAPYLQGATNGTIGPQGSDASVIYGKLDSAVGFSSAPQAAALDRAASNIGISSVAGAWGYQGARATVHNGNVHNTQLTYVNSVDAETGKTKWTAEAKGKFITGKTQVFSPPSIGKRNMYLVSGDGHLVCMDERDGSVRFMYHTKQPISFQPALANGRVFIGTSNGMIMSITSEDQDDAQDWTAWGGNAQHNKVQ
jgi:outer membrane protein assembly factor BamB